MHFLRTIAWLACVVYSTIPAFWLMVHPLARLWRRRARNPYALLLPIWIGLWVLVAVLTSRWRYVGLYETPWAWIPAGALFVTGIWLYRRAGANFSWSLLGGLPEVRASRASEQRLAVGGIRARVRHPIYLAHLLEMLAWSLGTGLVVCYALASFAVITGVAMIAMEDRELEQRFGEEYRKYKRDVPAILPRLTPYTLE